MDNYCYSYIKSPVTKLLSIYYNFITLKAYENLEATDFGVIKYARGATQDGFSGL